MENSDKSIPEKSNFVSYCAKEKTEKNRIYFNYPQFSKKVADAEKLNEIIVMFVKSALQEMCVGDIEVNIEDSPENWEWDNSNYTLQAMYIDYRIERSDLDYFSVMFKGLYNNKTEPQLTNYFNSLTIDLKKCEMIALSNLYCIDTDFVELIQKKFNEQIQAWLVEKTECSPNEISESVEEIMATYDDTLLLESLYQADKNSDYGFYSFLTNMDLGISIPLNHALGGHFEIMIAYNELEQFKI